MRLQLRVRTNDVSEVRSTTQIVNDGFILFDNCSEVKFGTSVTVGKDKFKEITRQADTFEEKRNFENITVSHSESGESFADVIYMVRNIKATEDRIAADPKFQGLHRQNSKLSKNPLKNQSNLYESPYHYNVIEWKDRSTGKRYRLIFDTVVFLTDDEGKTIRKIEG